MRINLRFHFLGAAFLLALTGLLLSHFAQANAEAKLTKANPITIRPIAARPIETQPIEIQLWHQMIYSHREALTERLKVFESQNPQIRVRSLYRETEELRSSFQSAALGGSGPQMIYGPSDQIGPLATMGLIQELSPLFSEQDWADFDPLALPRLEGKVFGVGDHIGNFLMLIYNRALLPKAPDTLEEFLFEAQRLTHRNERGQTSQWGLVFNMTEPYFFVPWINGFGERFLDENHLPHLNTDSTVKAFDLVRSFSQELQITPRESDYETANSLFKEGRAAMMINGDWSWGDYRQAGIDFGIAPFPRLPNGKRPEPLVGTKTYSINRRVKDPAELEATLRLLKFLTSTESQIFFAQRLSTLPSRLSARLAPEVAQDPKLARSAEIMQTGMPAPIVSEVRAVWDVLRKHYQSALSGSVTSKLAAERAQAESLQQIQLMNQVLKPNWGASLIYSFALLALIFLIVKVLRGFSQIKKGLRDYSAAWLMLLPALVVTLATILFPFFYNLAISFSNLGLRSFDSWQIVGFQNYTEVLLDAQFYSIFLKTIIWTILNLLFHVSIGIFLAILIDQFLPAKPLWRIILIIPWAMPQYIAALTWRGLFHQEYGPVNLVLAELFSMTPIAWLSHPQLALGACLVTNIWLGFPFMMMVALGGLQAIPHSVYESAQLDGASFWQRTKHITLPLLLPVMAPAIALSSFWTFNQFNVVWLVSNGGEPADQTHILVTFIYKSAFNLYRYSFAAAYSFLLFVFLLGLAFFVYRFALPKLETK